LLTSEILKQAAKEYGADLAGVGSVERWDSAPEENDPRTIMPRAKSVVCLGFRIHRGSLRGVEEGTYFSAYTLAGFADINSVIAPVVTRRVASLLEDSGFEAASVMYHSNRFGGYNIGRAAMREDGSLKPKPDGLFNYRVAAVLCGIGEIGHSRLLLTPEFGPAQRVYFIITDAPLEPDPIIGNICDKCMKCVAECPAKALYAQKQDDVNVPGVTCIRRGAMDAAKCYVAHWGGISPFASDEVLAYSKNIIDGSETETADGKPRPTTEEIADYLSANIEYTKGAYNFTYGPAVVCAACMRSCLAHLEKRGTLRLKFSNTFR
jgi:ferredoxin